MERNLAVVMSVYKNDRLEFVRQSVESLLGQSYGEFDICIQFDGPVREEVEAYLYSREDERLNIYKRGENRGLACSLNELLERVLDKRYTYVARMDADDIALPERLEKQIRYMETHPGVDCLGTWAIEIDKDGNEFYRKQMPETHAECLAFFRKRDCMIHPTVMFRRSYFEKAGLYPEDTYFGEDTMMWAKGFRAGCRFANLPEFLLRFRLDDCFFERRRGWKHAKSIYTLRKRVNRMLGFGVSGEIYACLYAAVKLMPEPLLNLLYKKAR